MSARGGASTALAYVLASGTILGALWVGAGQPTVEQLIGFDPAGASAVAQASWECFWQPTLNQDWHDDVLCVRGLESHRPMLLADRAFVTEAEMMDAAAQYAASLNG